MTNYENMQLCSIHEQVETFRKLFRFENKFAKKEGGSYFNVMKWLNADNISMLSGFDTMYCGCMVPSEIKIKLESKAAVAKGVPFDANRYKAANTQRIIVLDEEDMTAICLRPSDMEKIRVPMNMIVKDMTV